jgi:signal peptidase I
MKMLRTAVLVGAGFDLLVRGPRVAPPQAVAPPSPARRRPGPWIARAAVLAVWSLVCGLILGLLLCLSVPRIAGDRSFTEMSGSMRPALQPGDVLVVASIRARDAKPGEVVTFPDPAHPSRLLTHRVRSIRVEGGVARVITKGDANNQTESWSASADGRIGRVRSRIPKLGYALVHLGRPGGAVLFVALPCLLLMLYELRRIWRSP